MFFYPDSLSFSVHFLRSSGTSRSSRRSSRISRQDSSIIIAVYYDELLIIIAYMVNYLNSILYVMHILHVDSRCTLKCSVAKAGGLTYMLMVDLASA